MLKRLLLTRESKPSPLKNPQKRLRLQKLNPWAKKKSSPIEQDTKEDSTINSGIDLIPQYKRSSSPFADFVKPKSSQDLKKYYHSPQFLFGSQLIVIMSFLSLLTVSYLNFSLDKSLNKSRDLLKEKSEKLQSSAESYLNLKEISGKIAVHKQYESEFKSVSPALALFNEKMPNFEYSSFSLDKGVALISSQTDSPLVFSFLTNKYLSSGLVDQIVLKTASLDRKTQKYNLTMEVILK